MMVSDHNGSDRHKRYKGKVANILRRYGYTVFGDTDDEIAVRREAFEAPYYVDVCACNSQRILIVEIDGYKGHKTRRAILKDTHRANYIKQVLKCDLYRFAFFQLTGVSDDLIAEELGLTTK